jgi:hypothetical protein
MAMLELIIEILVSEGRRKDISQLLSCDGGGLMFQKYHMTAVKYGDHDT